MPDWTAVDEDFSAENVREVTEFIERQRWFGGKGRAITEIGVVDRVTLRDEPRLVLVIVEIHFGTGTSDFYQLLLGMQRLAQASLEESLVVTTTSELVIYEASADPEIASLIAASNGDGVKMAGESGEVSFRGIRNLASTPAAVRPLGADQSNTSVVLNEQLLVKLYRRIEAGINPELELLLFLIEHGFSQVPALAGWCGYAGSSLRSTLAIAQQYLPDAVDGWSLGLSEIPTLPQRFLDRIGRLGQVVGEMHCVLASDANDEDFAPEEATPETNPILAARIEERIDKLGESLPDGRSDDLRAIARILSQQPPFGPLIRCHGDLHLGQILWSEDDWWIIDFEGEPARSLADRRQKAHPLRDVAGILRSFAYLEVALELEMKASGLPNWANDARQRFLEAYRTRVGPMNLLPRDLEVQDRLIRIFELEKILYELEYETQHRPDWLAVPLTGLTRLLEEHAG